MGYEISFKKWTNSDQTSTIFVEGTEEVRIRPDHERGTFELFVNGAKFTMVGIHPSSRWVENGEHPFQNAE